MMEKLGKFESVDLKEIWPHEENNFTPWLADNIDELAKIIKVESIEVVSTEFHVGKYFC
jgi:hypothetical protein